MSFQNAEPLSAFLTFFFNCPHSSLKIQNVCQKINKKQIYTRKLALFILQIFYILPKSSPEISFFSENQIYFSISAFFYLKNDKKWAIFAIFFILPYTDGLFS